MGQLSNSDFLPEIRQKLDTLSGKRVLIIGDVGLDEYTLGTVRRISPEAPVPVVEVEKEELRLGLAANVAQNVASLGGIPELIAVVGQDSAADLLRGLLRENGVNPESLVVDGRRPTTRKTRVMVQNHHIVRVDHELRQFIQADVLATIIERVEQKISNSVAVIIQDYAKGVVSEKLVSEIVRLARIHKKPVCVDPHRTTPVETYRGVDLLTPNREESFALSHFEDDELRRDPNVMQRIGQKLMKDIGSERMVVTLGRDGMKIFDQGKITDLPTNAQQVFDVTGAGDTVIAALALGFGSGMSLPASCALANVAAGIVVGKIGCVPCPKSELIAELDRL